MTKYDENEISFYMFKCKSDNIYNCYVGHTTNFTKRKSEHKSNCKNENNRKFSYKVYTMIRENGGWENWCLIEIHKQFCKDKREAERIEQDLIEKNNADMNMCKAFRTEEQKKEYEKEYKKEYRESNKEKIKEQRKEYGEKNKDKIKEYIKEYREDNKDTIKKQRKEYLEDNKDSISKQQKEYYQRQKDKLKEYQKEYYQRKKEMILMSVEDKN